jgi:signal transduction histidine kinase
VLWSSASFLAAGLALGGIHRGLPTPEAGIAVLATLAGISLVAGVLAAVLGLRHVRRLAAVTTEARRLNALLECVTDGIWESDTKGNLTYLSPALADTLEVATGPLPMAKDTTPAGREDLRNLNQIWARMARGETFRDENLKLQLASGAVRHVRLSGRPRLAPDGTLIGYIGTSADVTAETIAAHRARLAERRLGAAIDSMAEGFALFDVHDRLEMRNWRLDLMLDPTPAEAVVGRPLKDILLAAAAEPATVDAFFTQRFTNLSRPFRFKTTDNRWLQVRLALTSTNGTQTLWSDVTLQLRQEQEEEKHRRERHHTQKLEAIGTLAGGIAHEINTPVQYVGDNLAFLASAFHDIGPVLDAVATLPEGHPVRDIAARADLDFLRQEIPAALDQSVEGVQQVARMVRSMKEFAHPSAREPIAVDLHQAVETTLTVSRNEWKHVAEASVRTEGVAPAALAVPGEINQVLLNLIVNAAHAIQAAERAAGRIDITLRATDCDGRAAVQVDVADNGTGMPADIVQRIFEPFFTTKDVGHGSGQGLAIVHDIVVRKLGGTLTVDSTPGDGTCFTLRLPAAPAIEVPSTPSRATG